MSYHTIEIPKGVLGTQSKIHEEYLEFIDALKQNNPIMAIQELSDLIGAIEAYAIQQHNITLEDLITMKNLTKKVFEEGYRK